MDMYRIATAAALVAIGAVRAASGATESATSDLFAGKHWTDQTITAEVIVGASPEAVYERWTSEAGVKHFFAPGAQIDPHPGGAYTILFVPDRDPQGLSHGTRGARVLAADPGRRLAFEWITFAGDATLGANAPPIVPRAERDERPLPTWVELTFDPLDNGRQTRLRFAHYGFRHGGQWEAAYAWFSRQWPMVLENLRKSFEPSP